MSHFDLNNSNFIVAGASGAIGQAICHALVNEGVNVIAVARTSDNLAKIKKKFPGIHTYPLDVLSKNDCKKFIQTIGPIDGMVYSVGKCPPNEFESTISMPLSDPAASVELQNEWQIQVLGLQHLLTCILPRLENHGSVVVINSAVSRIPRFFHPDYMHDGYYTSAKRAQEQMVRRMRENDPLIKEKQIRLNLIFPAAVDTPFHHGSVKQPPATVSTHQVAQTVIRAISRGSSKDYFVYPSLPKMIAGIIRPKPVEHD